MKKIFLALAAVAALASCVKENTLVPEQTADNLVTITAVSADTKTVLNGTDVLWQNNDAIKVVLTEGTSYKYDIELTTSLDVDVETAEFTFTAEDAENVKKFNDIKADSELDEKGYAIYPSTSAQYLTGFQIIHELPEEQDGTVGPGMNLSSALVTTADIKAGEANAMFNNALTLLQIKVPAGVTSVSLTANYGLVGRLEFNKPDTKGKLSKKSYNLEKKTVTLSTGSELDSETVYSLLVYPGNATELTLRMTGLDANDVYEKTISKVLEPSTYYTMDLTKIFNIGVIAETTLKASSAGDEFVIPVADAAGYEYTVTESADWITAQILETRAFSGKEIVLTVAANDGEAREAQVSIECLRETRTFTISQEGKAELSFVYVDPEDPESGLIQWEETFDIFGDNSLNNKLTASPYTGVFTIEINEENPEKGTYIVKNIFKNSQFTSGGSNHVNKGGEYYANYGDGKLTILKSNANISSYVFANDVVLTYDPSLKKFTSGAIELGYTPGGPYNQNNKFIGNYEAVHYVAPDPGAGDDPIAGTYNMTYKTRSVSDYSSAGTDATGEMVIEAGTGAGNYVITKLCDISVSLNATLNGTDFNFEWAGTPITFKYDPESKTFTYSSQYSWISDYMTAQFNHITAVKKNDDPIPGTYNMTYKTRGVSDYSSAGTDATGEMVIEAGTGAGNYVITKLCDISVSLNATLNGTDFNFEWAMTPITFKYDPESKTFTYSSQYSWISDYMTAQFNHITATKQ